MAVLIPQSAPPVSRTVVKPRSSMARNRVAARAAIRVSGIASMKRTLTSLWMACTWQSISPGIKVRLPQSITTASAALIGCGLSSLTVSPSTSNS
jgi:succinate dehydrogenase hydrophobic anchor subunit